MFSFLTKEEAHLIVTEFCSSVRKVQLQQQKNRCLAVIGTGRWGTNHLKYVQSIYILVYSLRILKSIGMENLKQLFWKFTSQTKYYRVKH